MNEPIINLALFHEFASFKQDTGDTSRALKILNSHLDEVKTLSYQPLSMAFYETLSRSYFAKNDYAKATSYASLVVNGETSSFLSGASVSAYETLFKIAETQGRYKEALEYYKKYTDARSLNISKENAKMLSIQKAKQDSIEKSNQITLLDKENSLLKARAMLDQETATNRQLTLGLLVMFIFFAGIWVFKQRSNYIKFREISQKDGLTGIANRHYFTTSAEETARKCLANNRPISFVMFDLDNFKMINDSFGHSTGDNALQIAVDAAKLGCRANDLIGRLGGEEFGILLDGCDLSQAKMIAESCRKEIDRTNASMDNPFTLTASFGVASSDVLGSYDFGELFDSADSALYKAKHSGKNRVEHYKLAAT